MTQRIGPGRRWTARLLAVTSVATVLAAGSGDGVVLADPADDVLGSASVATGTRWPHRITPGEPMRIEGAFGDECEAGTLELGLTLRDFDSFYRSDGVDPRDGSELVLGAPPAGPGEEYTLDVVAPPLDGVSEIFGYSICRWQARFSEGMGRDETWALGLQRIGVVPAAEPPDEQPSPDATATPDDDATGPDSGANAAPVANPDLHSLARGETLRLAAPGVLGNDSDPDGDQLVAVRTGVATTVGGGRLSFRPDGSVDFTVDPDAPAETATGAVCVAYHARDPQGATSEPTTLIVLVGDVGDEDAAVAAVATDGGCRPPVVGENAMELTLTDGPGDLPGAALAAAAPMLPLPIDTGAWLLAAPAQEGLAGVDPLAVQVPSNLNGCFRSNCLWGYFGPPSYACNQTTSGSWLNRRYGSMTGYAYLRKGLSDYVRVRPVFFQDGNRLDPQFVWRGGWTKKTFPYLAGPEMYNRWVYARLHMRFGSPGSTYLIGFDAEWYDERPLGSDRLLARSGPPAMLPYSCVAGGGL